MNEYEHKEITDEKLIEEAENLVVEAHWRDWSEKLTKQSLENWNKRGLKEIVASGGKVFATFDKKGKIVACSYIIPLRKFGRAFLIPNDMKQKLELQEKPIANMGGMAVSEGHLRKGLSQVHEQMRLNWAREQGFKTALTNTSLDSKRYPGLIKTGWKVLHENKGYWKDGATRVVMYKKL